MEVFIFNNELLYIYKFQILSQIYKNILIYKNIIQKMLYCYML